MVVYVLAAGRGSLGSNAVRAMAGAAAVRDWLVDATCSRVERAADSGKVTAADVGVDLGRACALVAEQLLDVA